MLTLRKPAIILHPVTEMGTPYGCLAQQAPLPQKRKVCFGFLLVETHPWAAFTCQTEPNSKFKALVAKADFPCRNQHGNFQLALKSLLVSQLMFAPVGKISTN